MGGIASPKRWNKRVGGHERVRQLCLRLPAKFPRDLASLADHALYSAQVSGLWSACTNARLGWERGCISSSEEVYSVNLYTSQLDMRLDFYVWHSPYLVVSCCYFAIRISFPPTPFSFRWKMPGTETALMLRQLTNPVESRPPGRPTSEPTAWGPERDPLKLDLVCWGVGWW